jgi:hypothetical protein
MSQSESIKKSSSVHVSETVIIYLIAAAILTGAAILAFVGWQG